MKWTLPLRPDHIPLGSLNRIEIVEKKPAPKHGYFAEYLRKLKDKDDWSEVTGNFRIFKQGKMGIVIELDVIEES
jgi:hypothetical protein